MFLLWIRLPSSSYLEFFFSLRLHEILRLRKKIRKQIFPLLNTNDSFLLATGLQAFKAEMHRQEVMAFPGLQLLSGNTQSTSAELYKYQDSAILDCRSYIKCFGSWNNYWKNTWNQTQPSGWKLYWKYKEKKRKQCELPKWSVWFQGWQVVSKGCFTF